MSAIGGVKLSNQDEIGIDKHDDPDTEQNLCAEDSGMVESDKVSQIVTSATDDAPKTETLLETKPAMAKNWVVMIAAAFLPLFAIGYQLVFRLFGIFLYEEQYVMIFVGVAFFLLFMTMPARKEKDGGKWMPWDVVPALVCLFACLYVAINWETIYYQPPSRISTFQITMGIVMFVFTLEACRRAVGWPMTILVLLFLAYALFGNQLTGTFRAPPFALNRMVANVYLSSQALFGKPAFIAASIVIAFSLFGIVLSSTGAGEFFYNLSIALVGKARGGAAKVAIVCAGFFATMTGEPISNAGIVAPLTLPLMRKLNYNMVFSGGVVAAASCGSMITPPVMAAVAFVMGEFTGLGFPAIAVAAIIPAILFYVALYFQVDFYAAKAGYKAIDSIPIPKVSMTFKTGWQYLIPILALIYFLIITRKNPATAVYYSTGILILIALVKKKDRQQFVSKIKTLLSNVGKSMIITTCICAAAGIIMGLVTVTGFGLKLSQSLGRMAGGNLLLLSIIAGVAIYIMGMGMPPIVKYIMMAILVAPAMVDLGVEIIAAHFFILYMSISAFITPPVALAGYVMGQMVGESGMKVSLKAMRLGIICYLVPFVCVYSPQLLLVGTPLDIVHAALTALIGVILLSAALEGFLYKKINVVFRLLLTASGLLLFYPGTIIITAIGAALAVAPVVEQIMYRVNQRKINEQS